MRISDWSSDVCSSDLIEVQLRGIVVAIAGRCVDADVVARVLRYDVDQTTSGVAAIQRALRAFENLNSLDIVEREGGGGGIRKIKAVKIGRDGQFGRIASAVLPNAAQDRKSTSLNSSPQCAARIPSYA